jgi:hypothetical protein
MPRSPPVAHQTVYPLEAAPIADQQRDPMPRRLLPLVLLLSFLASAQTPSPFGPNVFVYTPHTPAAEMQSRIDSVYARQQHSEFSTARYAFLFLPGDYHLDVPIGFYTQVLGLGPAPDDTHITGNFHVDAANRSDNATTTFWRSAEGLSVTPTVTPMRWAVSQAVALRRMHIRGDIVLNQNNGWASGGWLSDTLVDGTVDSGTQQQWISRNAEWQTWHGANWNMVFVGVNHPPAGDWPSPPFTKINTVPVLREKPFLIADARGNFSMIVPALTHNTSGVSWHGGSTSGRSIPLSHFFIARPTDSADTINRSLAAGKNLIFTPGIYDLTDTLNITHKDTVVFGLGFATIHPITGKAAMHVADVDGVTVSGLLFDAGPKLSPVLLEVGTPGAHTSHTANPISLHDIFFRVGGAGPGKTINNLVLHADDTIVDHTWIWRADHGANVGWTDNLSANGLTVNGNNVTIYGLFVEHHQQYQVLWNGERGRTYFYQSEIPYDPPTQTDWRSSPATSGWASYKVADNVQSHEAFGLGVYSVFRHHNVTLSNAIETPVHPGIHFNHMITIALDNLGEITHIINATGDAATPDPHRTTPKLTTFP